MNLAYFPGLQIESALSKEDALNFKEGLKYRPYGRRL